MKKFLSLVVAAVMLLGIFGVALADNASKPVIWYNRQPSNSTTGELDMDALQFNDKTYYVGFDAVQGAVLQGEMVVNYLKAHGEGLDRNGDGTMEHSAIYIGGGKYVHAKGAKYGVVEDNFANAKNVAHIRRVI